MAWQGGYSSHSSDSSYTARRKKETAGQWKVVSEVGHTDYLGRPPTGEGRAYPSEAWEMAQRGARMNASLKIRERQTHRLGGVESAPKEAVRYSPPDDQYDQLTVAGQ